MVDVHAMTEAAPRRAEAAAPSFWAVLRHELAEALLPQRCLACGRFGAALHLECARALPRAEGARCDRCWAPLRAVGGAGAGGLCRGCDLALADLAPPALAARRAAFTFEGLPRRAILDAKYRGVAALLPPLAAVAAEYVEDRWGVEAVVPVPLHPSRRRARGFNQSEVAAREVARRLAVPLRTDLLRRGRATSPQAALGRAARARNIEGAFRPAAPRGARAGRRAGPRPRRLLLVDDVTTTGATLEAAARALRVAGATAVYALALALED